MWAQPVLCSPKLQKGYYACLLVVIWTITRIYLEIYRENKRAGVGNVSLFLIPVEG